MGEGADSRVSIQGRYCVFCLTTLLLHSLSYNRLRLGLRSFWFVGAFVNCRLQVLVSSFVRSISLSVRQSTLAPPVPHDGFTGNFILESYVKICEYFRLGLKGGGGKGAGASGVGDSLSVRQTALPPPVPQDGFTGNFILESYVKI